MSKTVEEFVEMACKKYGCRKEFHEEDSNVEISGPIRAANFSGVRYIVLVRERKGKTTKKIVLNDQRLAEELHSNNARSYCARLDIPYTEADIFSSSSGGS